MKRLNERKKGRGGTERNMMIKEEVAEDISGGGRGLPRRTIAAGQRQGWTRTERERGRGGRERSEARGYAERDEARWGRMLCRHGTLASGLESRALRPRRCIASFRRRSSFSFSFSPPPALSFSLPLCSLHFPLISSRSRVSVRREIVYSPDGGMFDKEKR